MAYCELGKGSKASFLSPFPFSVWVHIMFSISAALAKYQNDFFYADLIKIWDRKNSGMRKWLHHMAFVV